MNWLIELAKILKEYKYIWLFILIFLGVIAPGFLIVFHFKPELIEKYDINKILILSLALTLLLLPINAVATAFLYNRLPDDYENETAKNVDIMRGALGLNAVVTYFSLLICYFASLNFKWFLGIVASSEILTLLGSVTVWHILKDWKK